MQHEDVVLKDKLRFVEEHLHFLSFSQPDCFSPPSWEWSQRCWSASLKHFPIPLDPVPLNVDPVTKNLRWLCCICALQDRHLALSRNKVAGFFLLIQKFWTAMFSHSSNNNKTMIWIKRMLDFSHFYLRVISEVHWQHCEVEAYAAPVQSVCDRWLHLHCDL